MGASPSSPARLLNPSASLIGIAAVQQAFCYLDGPAEVLSASTTCRRWRELATADGVWDEEKFTREGMRAKAIRFEALAMGWSSGQRVQDRAECYVHLERNLATFHKPVFGGDGDFTDAGAAEYQSERMTLAVYRRVFALKVGDAPQPPSDIPRRPPTHPQGCKMQDEDYHNGTGEPKEPGRVENGIRTAVSLYLWRNPAAAKAKYGPMGSWDTSEVGVVRAHPLIRAQPLMLKAASHSRPSMAGQGHELSLLVQRIRGRIQR